MNHTFGTLEFARYRLLLRAQDEISLPPYKGSAFRGGFGHALKRVACFNRGAECSECSCRHNCVYSRVFESPVPADANLASLNTYAPHPFVIEPGLDPKLNYKPGETLDVHLVLIGTGIEYLPHFLVAFDELGAWGIGRRTEGNLADMMGLSRSRPRTGRGRYRLEAAWHVGPWGERPVYTGAKRMLLDPGESLTWEVLSSTVNNDATKIELEFLTPVRIKEQGRLVSQLQFATLFRALFRRLSALAGLYCAASINGSSPAYSGTPPQIRSDRLNRVGMTIDGNPLHATRSDDPESPRVSINRMVMGKDALRLVENARNVTIENSDLHWHDWERYSQRQQTRMKLGGVLGHVVYAGPLRQFMPYLLLGEYVHVGKNTSFGLGQMRLRRVS